LAQCQNLRIIINKIYLETLIDLIASIKLLILKRYHDGQLASPSSSPNQSLETAFDQLIANKYSIYIYIEFNLNKK